MSEELNKKSGRAVAWSSVTEIISKLITPLVNIILARLLAPEAFGAVSTITMIISFAEIFTDAGFQKYIIQHEFSSEEELDKNTNVAFWTNFTVSTLVVVLITVFRHQLASLVGSSELGNAIALASLAIIFAAFSSIQMARFKRALDFKTLFFVRIGSSLIPLIVTVPLAFILRSFWALVIGTLCVNLFNAVVLTVKSKWKPAFKYDFRLFRQMFSFSAWTLIESVVIWLTTNLDIFIVGRVLDDYYLGIYKTSMTTVNSYIGLITAAVLPVLFSTLSRYQNDDEMFRATYWKFQRYVSVFVLPMSIGIFLFKELVTRILLGSQWAEAANFIGLWGLTCGICVVMGTFSSEVYRSRGNPRLSTIAQLLHIAFLIPAIIIAVNYDFVVLYTVRALMRLQFVLVSIIIMRAVYKFKLTHTVLNILPSIVSSLIMGAVGYLLLKICDGIWWQILSVFICIVVYFASLLLLFPKMRKEIMSTEPVKKLTGKFKKSESR